MYAYMKGTALESIMDIPITGPESAREMLDEYQRRFLPESDSQLTAGSVRLLGPAPQ